MVPAFVLEVDGEVFIEKRCGIHGENRALISVDAEYYRELADFFFKLLPESLPQRDYILRLTNRCDMNCPICLAGSNQYQEEDLPIQPILDRMADRGRIKLDFMGAEPTERQDLAEIIKATKDAGHITALHTNGIKIGDREYLKRLVEAGLDEVHLQFDGFDEKHNLIIRGEPMVESRARALAALDEFGIGTDLVVTLLKDVNENAMLEVLDYAAGHQFVKEVFFLGCRKLGRAVDSFDNSCLVPDQVISILEEKSGGRIKRQEIKRFQKLYFALLAVCRIRKCFYIHHYMVIREDGRWRPVSELIDLEYLEPKLDAFIGIFSRSRLISSLYLAFHLAVATVRKKAFRFLFDGAFLLFLLVSGFNLSRIKRRPILLGFITACDPWIHDEQVALNCGKGEISTEQGFFDSGADANVARERSHGTGGE